jgi:4-hydroxybenzoate polyprenyltransferase
VESFLPYEYLLIGCVKVPETFLQNHFAGLSRLKLFFALSRTPHGLLDMCTPAFGALLWLGHLPPVHIIILGLITTFAGYTAVYALNDVIDFKADKEKAAAGGFAISGSDLDGVLVRHPMAQGLLSFKEGLLWALAWAILALIGAYILNPVCVLIFLSGCALEIFYCLLWRVSPFRTFVSGAVKTSGAVAAVFAVDPNPAATYLTLLFLLLFFWEIGGQNIPNDWADFDEDRRMNAKTIPIRWGLQVSIGIVLGTIMLTLCINVLIFYSSLATYGIIFVILTLVVGCCLLLLPALKLLKTPERSQAMALFNKASYYPLALLMVVIVKIVI